MRSRLWILIWVLCILFPMAFLSRAWPAFGEVFRAVFSPEWMHILMHAGLYGVLGFLLIRQLHVVRGAALASALAVLLVVAVLHETLQVVSAGAWPGWWEELKDLLVDLLGGCAGIGAGWLWASRGRLERGPRESGA